jgi:hypothetical protein
VVVLDTAVYVQKDGQGYCPPEYMDILMMREVHLRPDEIGIEQPVTVKTWLGWIAALQGEGEGLRNKKRFENMKGQLNAR